MLKYILISLILITTTNVFAYQYVSMKEGAPVIYDTDKQKYITFSDQDNVQAVQYQTKDFVVFKNYADAEEWFEIENRKYAPSKFFIYNKSQQKKMAQINDAYTVNYDPESQLILGLRGGIDRTKSGDETLIVGINGAFVYDTKEDKLTLIDIEAYQVMVSYLPGISVKTDESLIAVLTGPEEVSYYSMNDFNSVVRKDTSNFWNYSHSSHFAGNGISELKFISSDEKAYSPKAGTNRDYGFLLSRHFWLRDRDIYMVKSGWLVNLYDIKNQKNYNNIPRVMFNYYDPEEDVFIGPIYENGAKRRTGYEAVKASEVLKEWGVYESKIAN